MIQYNHECVLDDKVFLTLKIAPFEPLKSKILEVIIDRILRVSQFY